MSIMAKTFCYVEYSGVEDKNAEFLAVAFASVMVLAVVVMLVVTNTSVIGPEILNNFEGVGLY